MLVRKRAIGSTEQDRCTSCHLTVTHTHSTESWNTYCQ